MAPLSALPRPTRLLAGLIVLGLLAACGGGSESSDSSNPPATGSSVTVANGPTVAGATYAVLYPVFDLSGTRLDLLTNDSAPRSEPATALSLVLQQVWALKGLTSAQFANRVNAQQLQTCTLLGGAVGSLRLTTTDANANGSLDAGDSVLAQFTNCPHGEIPVQGAFTIRFNTFTQTSTRLDASVSVTFNALVGAGARPTDSLTGDLSLAVTITSSPAAIDASVSGSSLAVNEGSKTSTLANYSGRVNVGTQADYTTTASGLVSTSTLTGVYTLTTPTSHTGVVGASATGGAWRVVGSTAGSMVLIAGGTSGMRVSIDANRDGVLDADQWVTWAQMALW